MINAVIMHEDDTVVTLTAKVCAGDDVTYILNGKGYTVTAASDVSTNHKIAVKNKKKGNEVYKYGEIIGYAIEDINIGDHVHENNLSSFK